MSEYNPPKKLGKAVYITVRPKRKPVEVLPGQFHCARCGNPKSIRSPGVLCKPCKRKVQ